MTHIQVSVSSLKLLKTPSLCGSLTSISEKNTDILDTTLKTQDEIHEVLLGYSIHGTGFKISTAAVWNLSILRSIRILGYGTSSFRLFLLI